ncbi:unnamed protein product, partial [Rotaria magnacalcarata]
RTLQESDLNNDVPDNIDCREVFDLIRTINDPEHPLTLEELHVVDLEGVTIDNEANTVQVQF